MKKLFILAILCSVLFQADARTKKKKRKKKHNSSVVTTTNTASSKPGTLVVSFISMGAGIDFASIPVFEKELKDFNKANKCGLLYELKNWGREGERDYCIHSPVQKCLNDFAADLKSKFNGNERILIKENSVCRP